MRDHIDIRLADEKSGCYQLTSADENEMYKERSHFISPTGRNIGP